MFDLGTLLKPEHEYDEFKLVGLEGASDVNDAYEPILYLARTYCPGVVLVGGAVRDTLFRRTVKDLDFMSVNQQDPLCLGDALGKPLLLCLRDRMGERDAYEPNSCLLEAYETEDKRVNLLMVKSIMGRIKEFPDTLSQCWFDGRYVYGTQGFCSTYLTHVVKYQHTMKPDRLEKLKAKYPDFAFEAI
jgi:hypothetical protein